MVLKSWKFSSPETQYFPLKELMSLYSSGVVSIIGVAKGGELEACMIVTRLPRRMIQVKKIIQVYDDSILECPNEWGSPQEPPHLQILPVIRCWSASRVKTYRGPNPPPALPTSNEIITVQKLLWHQHLTVSTYDLGENVSHFPMQTTNLFSAPIRMWKAFRLTKGWEPSRMCHLAIAYSVYHLYFLAVGLGDVAGFRSLRRVFPSFFGETSLLHDIVTLQLN